MTSTPAEPSTVQPEYVRVSNVQERFGLHRSTLYRMAARGQIKIFKVGGASLVRFRDMVALIEGGE